MMMQSLGGSRYVSRPGDFDGDRKADPVVVDSSGNWYIGFSASGYVRGGPYALIIP
ncbi:MAG: hypothetical protein L6437_01835 [Kiritimatiellae bacterium]|nr:hypothetical protein [Kiritimatiellia bacterium]